MAEIKLYDYKDKTNRSHGIGTGRNTAENIISQLSVANGEDVTVRINSGGGSVFEGWKIFNAFVDYPGKVIIKIDAVAASIASLIAMAGDEVEMSKASMLMIHKPMISAESLNADELAKEAETLNKIQGVITSIYVDKTGLPEETINEMINAETWMTPDQALALGFITSISQSKISSISNESFELIQNSASPFERAYANKFLKTEKDMNTEVSEALKANTNVLEKIANVFKNIFTAKNASIIKLLDGKDLFFEEGVTLDVGVAVFEDEALTIPLADGEYASDSEVVVVKDGLASEIKAVEEEEEEVTNSDDKIAQLESELAELKKTNTELSEAVNRSNKTLEALAKVQSNGEPAKKSQTFTATNKSTEKTLDEVKAERQAAREKYKKTK